jgi:chorismate mutase
MNDQANKGERQEGTDDGRASGWRTDGDPPRLFALRGAITAEDNTEQAILDAATELMQAVLSRNELQPEALVSCIFTCTPDLTAQFPAVAARRMGLDRVPLLCAQEIDVEGALTRTIRLLMHYYAPAGHKAAHVYLREATTLRADLSAAQ